MKQALVLAIASFGMAGAAFAQAPNTGLTPGPHDPNPPVATPDLRLPPPCASRPNFAVAGAAAKPIAAQATSITGGRVTPIDDTGDTQCSANGATQSTEAPGSPAIQ
jgi:hypothetical protein